jgi:hypothetical protein
VRRYQLAKSGIASSQSTLTLAQRRVIAEVSALPERAAPQLASSRTPRRATARCF